MPYALQSLELRLQPDLGDELDRWRRAQTYLPPHAEAARRLIGLGLNSVAAGRVKAAAVAKQGKAKRGAW